MFDENVGWDLLAGLGGCCNLGGILGDRPNVSMVCRVNSIFPRWHGVTWVNSLVAILGISLVRALPFSFYEDFPEFLEDTRGRVDEGEAPTQVGIS